MGANQSYPVEGASERVTKDGPESQGPTGSAQQPYLCAPPDVTVLTKKSTYSQFAKMIVNQGLIKKNQNVKWARRKHPEDSRGSRLHVKTLSDIPRTFLLLYYYKGIR